LKPPYEWQIGWRYTRAGKRTIGNGFISFISLVSMLGIALGVAALIVVLSVMNGFRHEVRDRMLSVLSHIEIYAPTAMVPDWKLTIRESLQHPTVIGAARTSTLKRCSRMTVRLPGSRCAASIRSASLWSPTSRKK